MQAMLGLGMKEEAGAFLDWMLHATRLTWPKLRIMYDIYGRSGLEEQELPHLAGHRVHARFALGTLPIPSSSLMFMARSFSRPIPMPPMVV